MPTEEGEFLAIGRSPTQVDWVTVSSALTGFTSEAVSIVFVASDGSDVAGATVTVHNVTLGGTQSYKWDGESLRFYVNGGQKYYLSVLTPDGYEDVEDTKEYISESGSSRTVTFNVVASNQAEYGIRFKINASPPAVERILIEDGVTKYGTDTNLTAEVGRAGFMGTNSFDDIYPWSDIRIITDSDNLLSLPQVMVRIPKYYVHVYQEDSYEYWMVCKYKKKGYRLPDIFTRLDGTEADAYEIARYMTSGNNKSVTGATPDLGLKYATIREYAQALGKSWHTSLITEKFDVLELLMCVEFGTRSIQTIAKGLTNGSGAKTGSTDALIISTLDDGDKPYSGSYSDNTSAKESFSWRGIEDPFGNYQEYIDGVILNSTKVYYCADWTKWSDSITDDYVQLDDTIPTSSGYIQNLQLSDTTPAIRLPSAINPAGDSDSDFADYYTSQSSNTQTVIWFGGVYSNTGRAGIFCYNCGHTADERNTSVSTRLSKTC